MSVWPFAPLASAIQYRKEFLQINDFSRYKRCRVQLHAQGIVLRDFVPGAEIKTMKQQVCKSGDFLVAEIDAKVGGFGIVPDDLDGAIVSSHYFLFEIIEKVLSRRFLDFFIRTPAFREQVAAQGSTNYAAIRFSDVLGYKLPLPPLPEQRRIVARIEALAAKIGEAGEVRPQSARETDALLFSETTKIFATLVDQPTEPIRSLGANSSNPIQTGPFGAQLHASEFVEDGVPVLNVGNVWPDGLRLNRLDHVLPQKAKQLCRYSIKTGDLLFARTGATLGKVCLVPEACDGWLMTGHLFRVRFDQTRIDNRFAFAALRNARSIHDQVFGQIRGATRPGFNTSLLGNVELPLPSLFQQRRIVAYLDDLQAKVDALKKLQAETAAELAALLPSILDQAFKGEM